MWLYIDKLCAIFYPKPFSRVSIMQLFISTALCTLAVKAPPVYQVPLQELLAPFTRETDQPCTARLFVQQINAVVSTEGATHRGDIYYKERSSSIFSLLTEVFELEIDLQHNRALLTLSPAASAPVAILFNAIKWYLTILTIQRQGLPLHSSLVTQGDRALLFCGPSGSGKSTISRFFASEKKLVWLQGSDELNLLFFSQNSLYGAPTPFVSSAGRSAFTEKIPVTTIYFLEHATHHRVEKVYYNFAYKELLKNIYTIGTTRALGEQLFDTVATIASSVTCKKLYFSNNQSIVAFLQETENLL